ncbi:MAG: Hsp20 family protein [Alphaproteobacteria bacterium]|nr:Hsp20 family protein [Alphaproteobacteria bacterium]
MRSFDLSPLFRTSVGFDGLARMLDTMQERDEQATAYPPYNIEKIADDRYRITMAVAGFTAEDVTITAQDNVLLVQGKLKAETEERQRHYLHRGIAGRAFERRFQLADHIRVTDADMANGLLHVELVREVPEAMKPRTIKINGADGKPALEGKAA